MKSLASADPSVFTFESSVVDVDGTTVVLDETYFYAEGGGQPADRGRIGDTDVLDVQAEGDQVVHHLADAPDFDVGETVESTVDAQFRRYCMRAHTASHVLYGAGRQLLDDLGYGGFDIGAPGPDKDADPSAEGKVRVDFSTPTTIDDGTLVELERLTNTAVWDSRPVSWETMDREEALAREDIAFNTKTEEGVEGESIRVVTIEGWDVAACGGTHVRNTREIGPVTVLERSNPGEGLTRVEFAVGQRAIRRRATDRSRAMDAAEVLQTGIQELPDAIERLREENAELRAERDDLQERLVDARLTELRDQVVQKDGHAWIVGSVAGLDANDLSDRAQDVVGEHGDVVALVDEDGEYLAVATTGDVDAGPVVDAVTEAYGGGGGGGPTVAQCGGFDAEAHEVVAFLRE